MSVRPIDVQISIHRANEFTKQADLQNQKFNIDQLTNARDFKQVVDRAQHQVVPTDQVYHNRIDKKEQNRRYRRPGYEKTSQAGDNNKDGDVSSAKVEIKEQDKGLNLDIRI